MRDTTHRVRSLPRRHRPSKSCPRVQPEKPKCVTTLAARDLPYISHHPSRSRLRVQLDNYSRCAVTYQACSHLRHVHAHSHQNRLILQQTRNRHNKLHSAIANEQTSEGLKGTIAQHNSVHYTTFTPQTWPSQFYCKDGEGSVFTQHRNRTTNCHIGSSFGIRPASRKLNNINLNSSPSNRSCRSPSSMHDTDDDESSTR